MMIRSVFFYETVLNRSFKGFYYDTDSSCIKTQHRLNQEDFDYIAARYKDFGFANRDTITAEIYSTLDESLYGSQVTSLPMKHLQIGTKLLLSLSYNNVLELLTIGVFHFLVCRDESQWLSPGDELILLDNGFTIGNVFYAKILRNGVQYPDHLHYYESDAISSITICPFLRDSTKRIESTSKFNSYNKIFAWYASFDDNGNVWFEESHLTERKDAAFVLDLIKLTVSLNPLFNKALYHQELKLNVEKDVIGVVFPQGFCEKNELRPFEFKQVNGKNILNLLNFHY